MATATKKANVVADFRALDEPQLKEKLTELHKELVEQKRAHAAGELPSPAVLSKIRKNIAKAMTVLGEKAAAQTQKEQEK